MGWLARIAPPYVAQYEPKWRLRHFSRKLPGMPKILPVAELDALMAAIGDGDDGMSVDMLQKPSNWTRKPDRLDTSAKQTGQQRQTGWTRTPVWIAAPA
jgi:hypothetical protein